jgi:hypothetical protein
MCDGPVRYIGSTATDLELLPPNKRSVVTFSKVQMPYVMNVMNQEMNAYMNMGMRFLTEKDVKRFRDTVKKELTDDEVRVLLETALPERKLEELEMPEFLAPVEEPEVRPEDLAALGALPIDEPEPMPADFGASAALAVPMPQQMVAPANGLPTVMLQAPVAAAQAPLQEQAMDEIPYSEGAEAVSAPAVPPAVPPSQAPINVQTATQPVLVVPVNVGQPAAAPPAEIYNTAIPGAPATIAVDTSPAAMQGAGLPPMQGGAAGRARSASRQRGAGGTVGAALGARVSVNKLGAGGGAAPSAAANVRVTVNKIG